jgi:nitroimidazol reductase NimA-like FMN-containing flavoprotein (pyridoxamine 5'-phosphate oxidase superfamily)
MLINEMTKDECSAALAHASYGRLGCANDNQPYVVPLYFVYEFDFIYSLSTFGQKIKWMRENPKVCVQIDEGTGSPGWLSVIAYGQYQELVEPRYRQERAHARQLLEKRSGWWQVAMAERQLKSPDHLSDPIFFRIQIESLTGIRAA